MDAVSREWEHPPNNGLAPQRDANTYIADFQAVEGGGSVGLKLCLKYAVIYK